MSLRSALLFLSIALAGACRSSQEDSAVGRHLEAKVWTGALERQTEDPAQWVPSASLALFTGGAFLYDDELSKRHGGHQFSGATYGGDTTSIALGCGALIYGAVDWTRGDEGQTFEVAAEGLMATGLVTEVLKAATQRNRPTGHASHDSFPSGHTSFAFAGATFLAREIEAETDSELGYAFFVPAIFVALNRVDSRRHWTSDVTAGAAIGILFMNWVYNAHFPEKNKSRPTIFETRHTFAWGIGPTLIDDRLALGVSMSF